MNNNIPRGQIANLLLAKLLLEDKYGAQLLSELQNDENATSIKQPTLYSTLSRMEKQGLISSYWRDSEIGGKRHYYHLTDFGKKALTDTQKTEINTKKYDEIGNFENFDNEPVSNTKSSYFETPQKQPEQQIDALSAAKKDDGVFLRPDEIYEIPSYFAKPKQSIKTENAPFNAGVNNSETLPDGGIFITETMPKESIPKVRKLAGDNLDFKIESDLSKKLKTPEYAETSDEKIEKLYHKAHCQNNPDAPILEQTLHMEDLQTRFQQMNIDFHIGANDPQIATKSNVIPSSKLFAKYFIIFLLVLVETAVVWLVFRQPIGLGNYSLIYIICPLIFAILPIYYLFSKAKQRNISRHNLSILLALLFFVIGSAIIYGINTVFFGFTFDAILLFPNTFIYPIVVLTNVFVAGIFDHVLMKKYT